MKQVGIARKERVAIEKLFYIKNSIKLKKGFSFGVFVYIIDKKHNFDLKKINGMDVFMGGERSLFKLLVYRLELNNTSNKKDGQQSNSNNGLVDIIKSHRIIKRFASKNDFGDLINQRNSINKNSKLILLSPFIGKYDLLKYCKISLVPEIYAPKFLINKKFKTNSVRGIPQGSVLYPLKKIKKLNHETILCNIGYNFLIQVEVT